LKGLFYGGGTQVLVAQIVGNGIITISTFVFALVVMYAVNAMGLLRISAEGENYGLDLHEHGISAYPEYVISSMGRPGGMAMSTTESAPPLGAQSASASRIGLPGSAH
jgi:ammonium transporter, Amt family